jgi:RHS repeat-associated protein
MFRMMRRTRLVSKRLTGRSLCLFLSYTLFVSFCAPFTTAHVVTRTSRTKNVPGPIILPINRPKAVTPVSQRQGGRREGEILVRFRQGISEQEKTALVLSKGARRGHRLHGKSSIEKLNTAGGQSPESLAAELMSEPGVEFAEPNYLIHHSEVTPDDPRFPEQWALSNTGQNGGSFGSDISTKPAWETTTGSSSTIIAVIDSGIDFTHPDLANEEWTNQAVGVGSDLHGWDYVTNSGEIKDEQGHSTAIAGIIAAQGNNSTGITGVMWRASLMSLRVLDNTGTGDVANAVEAIDYAVSHDAQIINLSWGTDGASLALKDAIERAGRSGVVVVCSAGNGGRDIENAPYYPASFDLPNLLSVASTDGSDQLTSWSNFGATHVKVAAPGVNILTTQIRGGYAAVTGTSASAPLVTGVVGLIKTVYPTLNARATVSAVLDGVRPVGLLSGKVSSGGVASASGALGAAQGPTGHPYPFPFPGGGNGGGNNGNSNGNGGQRGPVHGPPDGKGGDSRVTPPQTASGAPGPNLPNLDQLRKHKPTTTSASSSTTIQANLLCADCGDAVGTCNNNCPTGDPNFSNARLKPSNRTGAEGNNSSTQAGCVTLGSRNFNWGLPLLGLEGRAGMDLNLTLFYNSLVWTQDYPNIKFNADHGNPSAGFHLGFPILQQSFTDTRTNQQSYIMVTSSGGRVEFRASPTANIYETTDSTYTQLDLSTSGAPVVRYSDGTQMFFNHYLSGLQEYRCTRIQDRNGNQIDMLYDGNGHLQSITDTLSRVIHFNYTSGNLDSITQDWNGTTHIWATFSYGSLNLQPNFGYLSVNMPSNSSNLTVLTRVTLADDSYYTFDYSSYGQIYLIGHWAKDGHRRAYTAYTLENNSPQTDCPRVNARRDWAEYWNSSNGVPPEAITSYSVDPSGSNGWTQQTTPDHVVYKEYFDTSTTWKNGLPVSSEIFADSAPTVLLNRTTTQWTQDDEALTYQKNPRPIETNIYDSNNRRRRTTIGYYPFNLPSGASCNLANDITEYSADPNVPLRRTHTDYKTDSVYLNRRIIGLVAGRYIYDGSNNLQAKTIYDYDWPQWPEHLIAAQPTNGAAPIQHDENSFGPGTAAGRGNLVMEQHWGWDASSPNNFTKTEEYKWGYYTTGTVAFTRDPLFHQTNISYNDSNGGHTYAYPTATTDPDQRWSPTPQQTLLQYNYATGAVTRVQTPAPAGSAQGPVQTMTYDGAGRLQTRTQQLGGVDYSYPNFTYPDSQDVVHQYTTISDLSITAHSFQLFDGAGRLRAVASDHQVVGGVQHYKGQYIYYDSMGRPSLQSNPNEIDANWIPTGDDYTWNYTRQEYDWKGRPTFLTHPDGYRQVNSYDGCGCAGGEVVTTQDEAGRQRRLTMDILGRLSKVEEFKMINGNQTVDSTTAYDYDVLDHIKTITQPGPSTRSFDYDGFGRLWHRTTPEQGLTTYSYNADDTVNTVTDARGVITTFLYNARDMVTNINYGIPLNVTPPVAATNNVTYDYDAAGNRTGMTEHDQQNSLKGSTTYQYDQLSRLTSETRYFADVNRSHTLSYEYNRASQLMKVYDSFSGYFAYGRDQVGRINSVQGGGGFNPASYVSNVQYRAFDAVKQVNYGDQRQLSQLYDNRLRLTRWYIAGVNGYDYSYNNYNENTNRVTLAINIATDSKLDHSYNYDHVGRLVESHTSSEAREAAGVGPHTGVYDGPYSQVYGYDGRGNMTSRGGWGGEFPVDSASFDNHNQRVGMQYDLAGNIYNDGSQTYTYDATGQQATASGNGLQMFYDGDGLRVKKVETVANVTSTTYYVRSSVLGGQVVADVDASGNRLRGYVYMGGQLLAMQDQSNSRVLWVHEDPVTKGKRTTNSSGAVVNGVEMDPWGSEVSSFSQSSGLQPHKYTTYERDGNNADEAMARRYDRRWSRFSQPDPSDGSYEMADPQSLNRYAYVLNDPVHYVDPSGLKISQYNWLGQALNWWAAGCLDVSGEGGHLLVCMGSGGHGIGNGGGGTEGGTGDLEPEQQKKDPCANQLLTFLSSNAHFEHGMSSRNVFAPEFASAFTKALTQLNAMGITPTINSDYRTSADQVRQQQGGSGTNPAAQLSLHQAGYAVDINGTQSREFKTIKEVMINNGFTWGGTFKTKDPPHFEMNPFGAKGTKEFHDRLKAAADAAENFYAHCNFGT